ncbi:MAG: PorT family protein [Bacteroidales bacterium]|jgi:hypothetical protein|nr:PorT family protein [Bacteroidales bacterium]
MKKYIAAIILIFTSFGLSFAQNTDSTDIYKEFDENSFKGAQFKKVDSSYVTQHLIGIKYGLAMTDLAFSQDYNHKSHFKPVNIGLYYSYLHSLWGAMPYFGIEAGVEYNGFGFSQFSGEGENEIETKYDFTQIQVPVLALFRGEFKYFRLYGQLGSYYSYLKSTKLSGGFPSTINRSGAGIMGGGGIALKIQPVEIHIECNYRYTLSNLYNPKIYSDEYWLYTHANQLMFSIGLFFRLGK